eukprot:TRINITY_DN38198_c0_g1_i1.p1 TRINITY_DN38198_c0_g1~~TRINITY_DN38198_c0_g1_i1.p1  ORF type:complete len:401 (-),score=42.31 TRINITY_DN38198_c0_g1_i1:196-1398(-)
MILSNGRWIAKKALAQVRTYVVVPASQFQDLLSQQPHQGKIYDSHPLALASAKRRGEVLATLARSTLAAMNPTARVENAEQGITCNGARRGKFREKYDWKFSGRRVECKSSLLHWSESQGLWTFQFYGAKFCTPAAFDDLVLVLFTPRGIYIYAHDLQTGVQSCGNKTAYLGHKITFQARGKLCWQSALEGILRKLDSDKNGCQLLARIPLSDPSILDELDKQMCQLQINAFKEIPLRDMSGTQRGLIIQDLVQSIDGVLNPNATIDQPKPGRSCSGRLRPAQCRAYDWLRDGLKVECKSGMLIFVRSARQWKVQFQSVKFSQCVFDDLLLALYTPRGIYVYRHDLSFGLGATGLQDKIEGSQIQVYAARGELSWSAALDQILDKFDSSGCQRLALIHWT